LISLLGRVALLVALAACTMGMITGVAAGLRRSEEAWRWTRLLAYVFGGAVTLAVALMEYALLTRDFSVAYVAQVGSKAVPTWVAVVSLWSSLEGSILLWAFILAIYTVIFAWRTRDRNPDQTPWALGVLLGVGVFFSFLVTSVAHPFTPVSPVPTDGPGPNPLLQNHILMVIHPPALYGGYVGMSVPFAMASAALLSGKLDASWMRALRRWTLVPWASQTLGILLGGWWSYEVLGWGGYWAWDPVENASFLPWLTATAFLHSAMVMERKDHLKGWTLTLVLATFLLTILGTFMTRSGVFNSVHAFSESDIGPVILGFLAIVMVFSIVLLAARIDKLAPPEEAMEGPLSREVAFLVNNLLFVAFTFTVLLGTVFPLVNEVVTNTQISVGEPYFNRLSIPIAAAIVFMMGVGPALPWGAPRPGAVRERLMVPVILALATVVLSLAFGVRGPWTLAVFGLSAFTTVVHLREFWEPAKVRASKTGESIPVALYQITVRARRRFGGYIVHFGVISVAVAIAASSGFKSTTHITLREGARTEVKGYTLTYLGSKTVDEANRTAELATFKVERGGRDLGELSPAMNHYKRMGQPIGTPDVRSGIGEDLYLSLIQVDASSKTASLDVIVQPLVWWLWVGGLVMVFGTGIAVWPERRAVPRVSQAPAPAPAAAETK